jgi:hypothetical protein
MYRSTHGEAPFEADDAARFITERTMAPVGSRYTKVDFAATQFKRSEGSVRCWAHIHFRETIRFAKILNRIYP